MTYESHESVRVIFRFLLRPTLLLLLLLLMLLLRWAVLLTHPWVIGHRRHQKHREEVYCCSTGSSCWQTGCTITKC